MLKTLLSAFLIILTLSEISHAQSTRHASGSLVMESIPTIPARIKEKLGMYQDIRYASFADWAPAGDGMLVITRLGDANQAHHVTRPAGYRKQITFKPEPVSNVKANPNPGNKGFIFSRDIGGDENFQLYYYDMEKDSSALLTDGRSRNGSLVWSRKGDRFAFSSNKRSKKDLDLYISSIDGSVKERMIMQGEGGGWGIADWSYDEKLMIVTNYISVNESRLYLLDLSTGKLTQVPAHDRDTISYSHARFSPDEKGFYYVADRAEFRMLWYYHIEHQKSKPVGQGIKWDIEDIDLSRDGKKLTFTTNEDGYSALYLFDIKKQQQQQLSIPKGIISNITFDPAGEKIGFTFTSPTTPADAWAYDLKTKKTERWTFSETGELKLSALVEPQLIRYPTFDSVSGQARKIPAFVYKPRNAKGKLPVIIHIHGGPESQSRPGFNFIYQYMTAELGMAVVVPNVRGSTGYGKTYVKLDNGYKREDAVKDIGKLLDWIAQQPDLDVNRVAVWGGSYGGYMTLASMTHYSNRLKAGIDVVGISNFISFLENTSDYRRDLRRIEYGDERDPAMKKFLQEISPLTNVQKITRPMFIVQGMNDPRVPVSEAEQVLEALKKNNNTAWYLLANDEGHGFKKKTNIDFYTSALMLFLENYVMKD